MVKRSILDAPKRQVTDKTQSQIQSKSTVTPPILSDSDSESSLIINPFQSDSDDSYVPESCEEGDFSPDPNGAAQVFLENEESLQVPIQGQPTTHNEAAAQVFLENEDSVQVPNQGQPTTHIEAVNIVRRATPGKLDKHQYCYFCQSPVLKIARHLAAKHSNEPQVSEILAKKGAKEGYKEYLVGIKKMKNKGNFIHNVEELQRGGCNIVVAKRPSKARPAADFLPCIYCHGFFVAEELWKHVKNCDCRGHGDSYEHKKTLSVSRALLLSACLGEEDGWSKDVREYVLPRMVQDGISRVVGKDTLILRFGSLLLKKLGKGKIHDISQRMRQLGRLLEALKELNPQKESLTEFISGEEFDIVIKGTEKLCGATYTEDGRRAFKCPSLAVRLGHLLTKVGNVKRGTALRCQNGEDQVAAETFNSLLKSEWTDLVSSCALNTLKRRKDQKIQILPLTEDLVKVRKYILTEMAAKTEAVLSNPDYSTWRKLAQITMSRLILFNKRRGGEVSRLLLKTYQDRPKWTESMNKEILSSLQGLELALTKRLDLIEVPGKKNRKVPILVTSEAKEAMEALCQARHSVGIPSVNPFFFASKSLDGYLNSYQAMKAVVNEVAVAQPATITSTRLRKYIATVCQLFDLKEGEMEWLANHMGHELNIHRDFYRLHESTVEIAKVSRVLMAIDSGDAMKYSGKQLSEIAIDDIAFQAAEVGNGRGDCVVDTCSAEPDSVTSKRRAQQLESSEEDDIGTCSAEPDFVTSKRRAHQLASSDEDDIGKCSAEPDFVTSKRHAHQLASSYEDDIGTCSAEPDFLTSKRRAHQLESSDEEDIGTCSAEPDSVTSKRRAHQLESSDEEDIGTCSAEPASLTSRRNAHQPESSDEEPSLIKRKKVLSKSKSSPTLKRKWTPVELSVLKHVFYALIRNRVYPSGKEIGRVIATNECLKGRTVAQVKSKLQHLMKK